MDFTKRQTEILLAATQLIGEKGIQNLTTKNLAERMSFSEPALYRHFKNKNDILISVLLFYKGLLKKGLSEIIQSNNHSFNKIGQMIDFQFNHFSKNPAIIMVIFAETSFQYNHDLSKTVYDILTQKKTLVEQIISEGQLKDEIRKDISPSQLTNLIMGSMRFTVLKWRLENYTSDIKSEGKELLNTLNKLLIK